MKRTGILYRDIADDIKKKIFHETYAVGSMIPTENELSEQYSVSKITVRNAVEILVGEGYLLKQSGKGTFVISNRPFNHLSQAASFSSILEAQGHRVTKKVIGLRALTRDELPVPFAKTGDPVTRISRLYKLDGVPYIYTEHDVRASVEDLKQQDLDGYSLYHVLQKLDLSVKRFSDTFLTKSPTPETAEILELKENAGLSRVRLGFDANGELIEHSTSVYNTDVHPYEIDYEV